MQKPNPEDQEKAPAAPAKPSPEKGELNTEDLDKVSGGLAARIVTSTDPCEGGE